MTIDIIKKELSDMGAFFGKVIDIIPCFDIVNPDILPYGLKPHTRSISWIVEQVIVQQAKYNKDALQVKDVDFDLPDTSLHDCVVENLDDYRYFVNIKITQSGKKHNKNDISAVEKLYMQYSANPDYRLVFAVFEFSFNNTQITLKRDGIYTFSPQFLPIYVNPSNNKMQAYYHAPPHLRTREEFLTALKNNSKSIVL